MPLRITPDLTIDDADIAERFVRGSGPGGQNVNKVATAVELRFDAATLPVEIRERLRRLAGTKMTADGVLVIDARRHRTQAENRDDARERLVELLRRAATKPKRRRRTRPTAASREKRLTTKKRRAEAKHTRGRVRQED